MQYSYKPHGVCARAISFDIEDNIVKNVKFSKMNVCQTEEDVDRYLGLPTLANVPERSVVNKKNSRKKGRGK